jgi:hypothetical protein
LQHTSAKMCVCVKVQTTKAREKKEMKGERLLVR